MPALRRRADLDVLTWPVFDEFDVDVMVTTRQGGVSSGPYASLNLGLHVGDEPADVLENRRRAAAALGADLGDFVFCNQAHGREAKLITAADRGRGARALADAIAATDALVTGDAGVVLTVMVADCVPIVLYDPVAHVLAWVAAGRGRRRAPRKQAGERDRRPRPRHVTGSVSGGPGRVRRGPRGSRRTCRPG